METGESRCRAYAEGDVLCGRFRVVRFLGRGGMGEVYEAEDLELGARVALKTIRGKAANRPSALRRFKREIRLARQVTHPNVCRVFDLFHHEDEGEDGSYTFLTMELLTGETLGQRLRRQGRMPVAEALGIVRQLLAALAAAHEAGVVHRDFKSDNVYLEPGDGGERVVVTDFGLAQRPTLGADEEISSTASTGLMGTPAYVSPEQLEGGQASPATDIYALGIVMYEMVTGDRPFSGPTPLSAAVRRLVEEPTPPKSLVDDLDPRWEAVILRCLARDASQRFQSVDDVVPALTGSVRRVRVSRRAGLVAAGVAAVLVVLAAGVSGWLVLSRQRAPDRPSFAVIGFKDLDDTGRRAWLATALTEMLATELATGEHLQLIPGEDVARARLDLDLLPVESFSGETLVRLRSLLGSDYVVMGSFLALGSESGDRIRVDVRVQETVTGSIVAACSTQGSEGELFDIVSSAGADVRQTLGFEEEAPRAPDLVRSVVPGDPEAARLYTQGLERLWRQDALQAQQLLGQAVAIDPEFPLARAALARAWSTLGHGRRAAEEAKRAVDLSEGLPRSVRLLVEAQYREAEFDWPAAINIYRSLWTFFPDTLHYGLRLAEAQLASGMAEDAADTVDQLRLHPDAGRHPRLDLVAARIRSALSDYEGQCRFAASAGLAARELGARLLVARARHLEGLALWKLGRSREALDAIGEAQDIFRIAGDRKGEAETLMSIATAHRDEGRLAEAQRLYRVALEHAAAIGDVAAAAEAQLGLANLHRLGGELALAEELYREVIAVHRENGNLRREATALSQLAIVHRREGDLSAARAAYSRAHAALIRCGDRGDAAAALNSIAVVLRQQGDLEEAARTLAEVVEIKRAIGNRRALVVTLVNIANVHLDRGALDAAEDAYGEALAVASEVGHPRHASYALFGLGEVAMARGRLVEALRLHRKAFDLRVEAGEKAAAAASSLALGLVLIETGDAESALQHVDDAFALLVGDASPDLETWAHAVRARAAVAAGDLELAGGAAKQAASLAASIDDTTARLFVELTLARLEMASGDPGAAVVRLSSCLDETIRTGLEGARVEGFVLLGEAEAAAGDAAGARDTLATALALARRHGYVVHERAAAAALRTVSPA